MQDMKSVDLTVKRIVDQRLGIIKEDEGRSATTQGDTEYTRIIDLWIRHYYSVLEEKKTARDIREARHPGATRREERNGSEDAEHDNEDASGVDDTPDSRPAKRQRRNDPAPYRLPTPPPAAAAAAAAAPLAVSQAAAAVAPVRPSAQAVLAPVSMNGDALIQVMSGIAESLRSTSESLTTTRRLDTLEAKVNQTHSMVQELFTMMRDRRNSNNANANANVTSTNNAANGINGLNVASSGTATQGQTSQPSQSQANQSSLAPSYLSPYASASEGVSGRNP